MFLPFFDNLRKAGVPVSLREYLTFLEGNERRTGHLRPGRVLLPRPQRDGEGRTDHRPFRPRLRGQFRGAGGASAQDVLDAVDLPADWLEKMAEKHLTPEEKAEIEALGGFDKLMETLKERLRNSRRRHQGGNKWIGTAGTSPFGAHGYNPEGVRIGQDKSRHQRAVKVWDKREFRNLDDSVELGTRNIKVALKRLRQWARDGAHDELDLDGTIRATAEHGYLDVQTRPERRNAVKVLLFPGCGRVDGPAYQGGRGIVQRRARRVQAPGILLFSQLPVRGRVARQPPPLGCADPDLGRAAHLWLGLQMHLRGRRQHVPYEIAYPGGANEHWNSEAGQVWLERARAQWPAHVWINPVPQAQWGYTHSIRMIADIFEGRMVPMTLEGIDRGMRELLR